MSKKKRKSSSWQNAKVLATLTLVTFLSLAANGWLPDLGTLLNVSAAGVVAVPAEDVHGQNERGDVATPRPVKLKPHVIGVVGPLRSITDGLNNFHAISLKPEGLRAALTMGTIKKVLNLSGDIPGKVSMAQVHAICDEYLVEYVTSGQLDRFDALSDYQVGKGYVRSAAARYLLGGHVLVVDRSGDRAGALVGAYLIRHHGFSVEQVIMHNNWEGFALDPGEAFRYLETVTGETWVEGAESVVDAGVLEAGLGLD
jgi:hypothetical protein